MARRRARTIAFLLARNPRFSNPDWSISKVFCSLSAVISGWGKLGSCLKPKPWRDIPMMNVLVVLAIIGFGLALAYVLMVKFNDAR